MDETFVKHGQQVVEGVYRSQSRRVVDTLIRLFGDIDRAEEALHGAFAAAVEQWGRDGVPDNPRAWLVSTGRFRAVGARRRRARRFTPRRRARLQPTGLKSWDGSTCSFGSSRQPLSS